MSPRKGGQKKILVTAGPTRERIDPVRYLSNDSSGKMGFAIAEASVAAGHEVTLIAGPVELETPKGVKRINVESAREMLAEVRVAFPECDTLFMAAAVCDFRPARRLRGKWRKKDVGQERASLELLPNPDILGSITRRKGDRLIVGFALETSDGLRRAREKLERKRMDYVVLNGPSALNATKTSVKILGRDGSQRDLAGRTKSAVAKVLVGLRAPSAG
jgi:phosphopantothenoylcysteine decarboxylase/phosphopantothenate--cysteine ligase